MNLEELFVGGVAILLGLAGIVAAIGNWDRCYRSTKVRWIESLGGRAAARVFFALIGAFLIVLGAAIALGFGPNKKADRSQLRLLHNRGLAARAVEAAKPRGVLGCLIGSVAVNNAAACL
jgi:hypothetical protein